MKKRFSEEQIIGFLREAEAGLPVKELCRKHGFSEASYYLWQSKFGGMIYLKLRQAGYAVNYKRVERLYQEAKLQVRRCKRKKVSLADRQPLVRPATANEVWFIDFVFDRTAEGRVIKCLTVVDDATHEAVAVEVEPVISGVGVARVADRLAVTRELPKVIRSDNGKEFCGKAMVTWAHTRRAITPDRALQTEPKYLRRIFQRAPAG